MQYKEDLRIVKTKNSLNNAFFEMLREMPIEDITVNELCERAGVRRATFYKHFNDKIDFLTYLIKDIRESFDREFLKGVEHSTLTVDYYVRYVQDLGTYLLKREDAFSKILKSPMRATFIDIFMKQNYIDTANRLQMSIENGMQLPSSVPVVASMLIGGVSHNIIRWFELENRPPMESLILDISKFIHAILR